MKFSMNKVKDITKRTLSPDFNLSPEGKDLISNLEETKSELNHLKLAINYITDPILLNQLIFQIKAAEVRYQYLFCMAREMYPGNLPEEIQE